MSACLATHYHGGCILVEEDAYLRQIPICIIPWYLIYRLDQGRIEPLRGHATSNSANIDSVVLSVTKIEILVLHVRPPIRIRSADLFHT